MSEAFGSETDGEHDMLVTSQQRAPRSNDTILAVTHQSSSHSGPRTQASTLPACNSPEAD